MVRRTFVALCLAFALGLAICGSSGARTSNDLTEALARIEEEIDRLGPLPGLGEASPPPSDAVDWKTDFSTQLVPLEEFQPGGPGKDGIPAIDAPRFNRADEVDWLDKREPVILVEIAGQARAYPIQVLAWHEIVNDRIGLVPIAVTFCPLCNTAIVFDRRLDGQTLSFGTTGKLRDSDLVMYDRQTESWWQQFSGEALVGELAGTKLKQLATRIVAWEDFRHAHPTSTVLSRDTGYVREYGRNPYAGYDSVDSSPLFETRNADDDRLPPKERVVYVEVGDRAFAVPFSSLAGRHTVVIETPRGQLVVSWKPGVTSALDGSGIATGRDVGAAAVMLSGQAIPFSEPFWFAVAAFRPDIEIVDG